MGSDCIWVSFGDNENDMELETADDCKTLNILNIMAYKLYFKKTVKISIGLL